jgi:hypothetical protein
LTSLRLHCHLRQLRRRDRQVARPNLRLHRRLRQLRRRVRQVTRPSSGSVVVFVRSLDLSPALSSCSSGRQTSLQLRRRLRQLGRPPQDFTSGMKASSWGACLIGPANYFRLLGRFCLETFLRSAHLRWLCQTPCSYAGYLVSLHSICLRPTDFWLHHRPTPDIATSATTSSMTSSFNAPFKILLGILGY